MADAINSMLEALQTPETRHAAFVHMPIALSVLGAALAVITALWGPKRPVLRWLLVAAYFTLAFTAWLAEESGEDAEAAWGPGQMAAVVYETIEHHEHAAGKLPPLSLALTVVAAIAIAAAWKKQKKVAAAATWLVVAGGLGLAGWTAYVAHLGGSMVYGQGVGTPFPVAADGGPLGGPQPPPALPEGDENAGPTDPRLLVFRQVRPILEEHCMRCHNPQRMRRAGGLDQTTIAGLLTGGYSEEPALIPGRPDDSQMMKMARHEIEDFEMPPDDDKLSDEQLALIAQWIRDGAVWE